MKTALLLIDLQEGFFNLKTPLYRAEILVENINILLSKARKASVPVVWIQHCGRSGHPLEEFAAGHQLISSVTVEANDVLVKKRHPDAFHATHLHETLQKLGITHLVIAGLQTEYCIDTTCRRGFSLGYSITLVEEGHSTFDSSILKAEQIIAHHNEVLGNLFSIVKSTNRIEFV